jgi:hypothetical protein
MKIKIPRLKLFTLALLGIQAQAADPSPNKAPAGPGKKPNILVIFGDDIGYWNIQRLQPWADGVPHAKY